MESPGDLGMPCERNLGRSSAFALWARIRNGRVSKPLDGEESLMKRAHRGAEVFRASKGEPNFEDGYEIGHIGFAAALHRP